MQRQQQMMSCFSVEECDWVNGGFDNLTGAELKMHKRPPPTSAGGADSQASLWLTDEGALPY